MPEVLWIVRAFPVCSCRAREVLVLVLPCSSPQSCLEWRQLPFKIGITLQCYLLDLLFPMLKEKVSISFKSASSSNGLHVKGWNKSICVSSLSNSNDEWSHKGKNTEIQAESVVNWLLVWSQLPWCLRMAGGGWGHGADSWPQHAAELLCLTRACISCVHPKHWITVPQIAPQLSPKQPSAWCSYVVHVADAPGLWATPARKPSWR